MFLVPVVLKVTNADVVHESNFWEKLVFRNGTQKAGNGLFSIFRTPKETIHQTVSFLLNTREMPTEPLVAKISDKLLFEGKLDPQKLTKILVHGFHSGKNKYFASRLRQAYLHLYDYNIITVDWSVVSTYNYLTARNDVAEMGKLIAQFIDKLRQTGLILDQIHMIGHSLGAHVAGVAGRNILSGKLPRITGLDPAGPLFAKSNEDRIAHDSADFVDIIHTCGNGLGMLDAIGHVDFYPNGGKPRQPGCGYTFGKCSHERAVKYYAESIFDSPEGFLAFKCGSWHDFKHGLCNNNGSAYMGEFVSTEARGSYWLITRKSEPFALGTQGIPTITKSAGSKSMLSKIGIVLSLLPFKWLHFST